MNEIEGGAESRSREALIWDLKEKVRDLKLQLSEARAERDRLMMLAELVWQSKSLLEAHQHFTEWRDKAGDFAVKQRYVKMTMPEAVSALDGFLKLKEGWDSYGAKPINPAAVGAAKAMLWRLGDGWTPVPCSGGGVQL